MVPENSENSSPSTRSRRKVRLAHTPGNRLAFETVFLSASRHLRRLAPARYPRDSLSLLRQVRAVWIRAQNRIDRNVESAILFPKWPAIRAAVAYCPPVGAIFSPPYEASPCWFVGCPWCQIRQAYRLYRCLERTLAAPCPTTVGDRSGRWALWLREYRLSIGDRFRVNGSIGNPADGVRWLLHQRSNHDGSMARYHDVASLRWKSRGHFGFFERITPWCFLPGDVWQFRFRQVIALPAGIPLPASRYLTDSPEPRSYISPGVTRLRRAAAWSMQYRPWMLTCAPSLLMHLAAARQGAQLQATMGVFRQTSGPKTDGAHAEL